MSYYLLKRDAIQGYCTSSRPFTFLALSQEVTQV